MIRAEVTPGDVLYTIAGSIGNACVVSGVERANINQAIVRMRPNPNVSPQYLADFLNTSLGRLQSRRVANGGVQLNINFSEVKALKLLVPPLDVQKKFVDQLATARAAHAVGLQQATRLLDSIDTYLLNELGILLPEEVVSTISSRIFTAQRRDIAGWRFDPLFHAFKLWHAIDKADVPQKKLGHCCHYIKTGFAAGGGMQLFDDDGVIQIRPTNVDSNRQLVFDRNVYLDRALLTERADDVVQYGEVLFNNTNSQELVGKTTYMNIKGQDFFCSNHMTRIRVIEDQLDPEYLTAILNAYQRLKVFFSLCTNWNNQSGVNIDLLAILPIPLPDITTQKRISQHIRDLQHEAKRLRQSAQSDLEATKRHVESLLFGDAA